MTCKNVVYTGDSFALEVNLFDGTDVESISSDAVITVGFVRNRPDRELLAGPWTASEADPDSDWMAGKIIVNVVGADTEGVEPQSALIETQVVKGGNRITYQSKGPIQIRKGALP